jgi:hypothetical protein
LAALPADYDGELRPLCPRISRRTKSSARRLLEEEKEKPMTETVVLDPALDPARQQQIQEELRIEAQACRDAEARRARDEEVARQQAEARAEEARQAEEGRGSVIDEVV